MSGHSRLISGLALLLAGALGASAPAAEKAEPEPAPAPAAAPAPAKAATARQAAQDIFQALSRGDPRPLGDAIDTEALLARTLEGLSTQPSAVWRTAALARLDAARDKIASAVAQAVAGGLPRALGETPGPDGTAAVGVRLYTGSGPAWFRALMVRRTANWRVADLDLLQSGEQLSNLALSILISPDEPALPQETAAAALGRPIGALLGGFLGGILIGWGLFRMLSRPAADAPARGPLGSAFFWIPAVAGAVTGLALFAGGLGRYLNACGAADEIKLRAASRGSVLQSQMEGDLRMVMLRLEEALKLWPQNRMAQAMKASLLAGRGKPEDAAAYLTALAGTDSPPPAVYLLLANVYERRGEWPKAAGELLRFTERIGPDGLLYSQAAQQYARARDFRGAEDLLARAAAAEPPDINMLMARTTVHAAARRVPEVIADLKAIIARREVSPSQLLELVAGSPDFAAVRDDPAFKAFAAEAGGGAPRAPAPKTVPAPAPEGAPKGGE